MARGNASRGQGTGPIVAMTMCVLVAIIAAVALWYANRQQTPAQPPPVAEQPAPPKPDPAAGQQAARVLDEDDRIEANVFSRPQAHPLPSPPTLLLAPRPQPYTLDSLIALGSANRDFVHVTSLGFWSGRTGGVALTGTGAAPSSGTITNTQIENGHYGLFTDDISKLVVADSTFSHNELTGVLLHRGTTNVDIQRSVVEANGADGFVADRGSESVVLRQITATANHGDGVRLDGRPLAEDSGPAGASNVPHKDFRLEGSLVRANQDDGVQALDGDHVVITGNRVVGHQEGIVVTGQSVDVEVSANEVVGSVSTGIALRDGPTNVVVRANKVEGGAIGLQVRDAHVQLRDNAVSDATNHGLSVVGEAGGTTVEGNSLRGAGASAVDVARLAPDAEVTLNANDDSGWKVQVPIGDYLTDLVRDHPLLPLWVLVLLAPIFLIVLRRRRSSRPYIEGAGEPEPPAVTGLDVNGETLLLRRALVGQPVPPHLRTNGGGPR